MRVRAALTWVCAGLLALAGKASAADAWAGDWALTLPSGEAGWLALRQQGAEWQGGLLWAVGSEKPVEHPRLENGALHFTRSGRVPGAGRNAPAQIWRFIARLESDVMRIEMSAQGAENDPQTIIGRRMPPPPARPDLSTIEFGEAVALFNGRDLTGWAAADKNKKNGWSARAGVLRNDTPKTDFSAYGDHANLRTQAEFDDFELSIDFRLPPGGGGNSGIYLRGLYEVQVTHRDSAMQGINGPGAVFGRIEPALNAGKAAGEWESYLITLVDRHVTVVHNGVKVIDNQPVAGPTGGALGADVTKPGPLLLQGDHTSVEYRNISLRRRIR